MLLLFIAMLLPPAAAQSSDTDNIDNGKAEPYSEDEFPTWAHDIRRAEIITIGSLPFTTLATTICYSLARYAHNGFEFSYVPNPFAKSGVGSFNQTEQITIFATAGGISIGVGIADLIVHIVRRHKQQRLLQQEECNPITITPLQERDGEISDEKHHYPPPLPMSDDATASKDGDK